MWIFCVLFVIEMNIFLFLWMDFVDFKQSFYVLFGVYFEMLILCSGVFFVFCWVVKVEGFEFIEGIVIWVELGGLLNVGMWVYFYDEILDQVCEVLLLDVVVVGLYGVMIVDGCIDCEGVLLEVV